MSAVVTYARKRRRVQNATKTLLPSSPLEVLPPDMDNLTRTQMARRMLKRSRRAVLAEPMEDKNAEHIRECLAKRIMRNQERDMVFPLQTPFPSQSARGSIGDEQLVPEPMSPGPVVNRVLSRTRSRGLKENNTHQHLASPFNSRPGSAAASPTYQGRGRSSRRPFCTSYAKSRTVSGAYKENSRRVLRQDSTSSLKDTHRESSTRRTRHQRYSSGPSTSYMRAKFAQEVQITPSMALSHTLGSSDIPLLSRTLDDEEQVSSPVPSVHSSGSFYAGRPQFCSTPAISRLRKVPDLHGCQTRNDDLRASPDLSDADDPDVEMLDSTAQRQTVHLSGNSIFSSSDDFTIRSRSAKHAVESDNSPQLRDGHQVLRGSPTGSSFTRSFVLEYDIPLAGSDSDHSPASTTATKMLHLEGGPKQSVGEQPLMLLGSSPAHGENFTRLSKRGGAPKSSVAEQPLDLPGTSPGFGEHKISRDPDGKQKRRPSRPRSLRNTLPSSSARGSVRRAPARDRAGTIRPSDFAKPSVLPSGPPSNARRTRSGTVVGPSSKLATKAELPPQVARGPARKPAAVPSGPESDDELLLKSAWVEDLVYLGIPVPPGRQEAEADELNLGGKWHGLESGPPCPPGSLRRR